MNSMPQEQPRKENKRYSEEKEEKNIKTLIKPKEKFFEFHL